MPRRGGGGRIRDHDGDGIPNSQDEDWLNRNDDLTSWIAGRALPTRGDNLGRSAWQAWLESQRFRGRVNQPVINKDQRKSLLAMYQPGQGPNNVTGNGPPGPVPFDNGGVPVPVGPGPGSQPGDGLNNPPPPGPATPPPGIAPPPPGPRIRPRDDFFLRDRRYPSRYQRR